MEISNGASYRFFARWAIFSYQKATWIIFLAVVTAALSVVYTANNLGIHTDTTDMLSEDVPFRVNHKRYKEAFPQYEDAFLLVVDAPTPEQAHAAAKQLTSYLQHNDTQFYETNYVSGDPFFEQNGLFYKSIPELEKITDRLAAAQPLIARLAKNPSLDIFAATMTEAVDEISHGRNLNLETVFKSISATLDARLAGMPRPLSWQLLLDGEKQSGPYREIILTRPKLDYTQLFAAEESLKTIRNAAENLGITSESAENLRITGEAALAYDELHSAMRGAQDAGVLALVLVVAVLLMALRTFGAILSVLFSLILGLLLTAAFAALAVGHLNLISIAFAVLYIGLGVDYAIHFLLRHEEIRRSGQPVSETLPLASGDIGSALMICAVTSAIGFYAFIPTTYDGVAELGLISGTGMIISLLVTITIVPALQRFFPISSIRPLISIRSAHNISAWPIRARKSVYTVTTIAILFSAVALPQIRFDYNLLNLNDPRAESIQAFRDLLANAEDSPWHIVALAENQKRTEALAGQLGRLPEVDKVVTLLDFVPEEQAEKSRLIEEMAMTLGPISFAPIVQNQIDVVAYRSGLQDLQSAINRFLAEHPEHSAATAADTLQHSLKNLLTRLGHLNELSKPQDYDAQEQLLSAVEQDLLQLLPESISRLQLALEATPFTRQDIPESIQIHWQSKNDVYRIAIYPAENINDNNSLKQFVRAVQTIAPSATGVPVISLEAGKAVVDAFIHALSLALVGVIMALLVLLKNVRSTLLVLVPLLLAAVFTGATTVLLDIPFNFANVIALPLILGIGIDCSVHMVHRSRNSNEKTNGNLLHTSTARAIFYSALTTMAGFGSLIFSQHQGTASMGLLLLAGVLLTLVCVLVILPALLHSFQKNSPASEM